MRIWFPNSFAGSKSGSNYVLLIHFANLRTKVEKGQQVSKRKRIVCSRYLEKGL